MSNTIKAISYEEYINTPSLRNVYNDTIVKCTAVSVNGTKRR